jgi:hypothetical protein
MEIHEILKPEEYLALRDAHKNAELHMLECGGHHFIVKVPNPSEWRLFKTTATNPETKVDAEASIVRSCVVYPDKSESTRIFMARPGLMVPLAEELIKLAGALETVQSKKLT